MGGGASSQAAFEQMLACTMILGEAMVTGLDPRYVRFPDMYRLYDFHVGPKKHQQRNFQGGQMVLFLKAGDDGDDGDDGVPQMQLVGDDGSVSKVKKSAGMASGEDEDDGPAESTDEFLVVYVSGDKVVLDMATLNQPNNDGWTPLHACCHTVNAQEAGIAILKELVRTKANLNLVTRRGPGSFSCGWTPLHVAVAYGLEPLALKLIRAGADVNTKNTVGWTPLYEACHRGYVSVARELLKAGAKHDVICPEFALCPYPGQFPLAEAARQGSTDTVKVLLEWGVDKDAVNGLGWTALHEAAYHNRAAVVKALVVYGVDVLIKTQKGSLAKDVTISGEIRSLLEDIARDLTPVSPKKTRADDVDGEVGKSPSPKKSPAAVQIVPLSRKEDYALLGDLPSLDARAPPTISIRDADEVHDDDDGKAGDGDEAKGDDDATSPSKSKHKKKRKHKKNSDDAPAEFKCALTLKLLKDPLRSPYGQVFERRAIEAWFRDFGNRCPLTGQPLTMTQVTPDEKLRTEIREWKHGSRKQMTVVDDPVELESVNREAKSTAVASASPAAVDDPYDF